MIKFIIYKEDLSDNRALVRLSWPGEKADDKNRIFLYWKKMKLLDPAFSTQLTKPSLLLQYLLDEKHHFRGFGAQVKNIHWILLNLGILPNILHDPEDIQWYLPILSFFLFIPQLGSVLGIKAGSQDTREGYALSRVCH